MVENLCHSRGNAPAPVRNTANLLSSFPARAGRFSRFLARDEDWKIIAGRWARKPDSCVVMKTEDKPGAGESMAVIGPSLSDIDLRVRFTLQTDTIRPPDGGAIIFFLVRNAQVHLSFHFCVAKNRIQLFKRTRRVWTMLGEGKFAFGLNREYDVQVRSRLGLHECRMEDGTTVQAKDGQLERGCTGIGGKLCDVEFSHFWASGV